MQKKKPLFGVAYNDADYVTVKKSSYYEGGKQKFKVVWACPYFGVWKSMISRCYSEKFQERGPTYKGCTVCPEWLHFSNFKAWMETQDWEGKQLDKDIISPGNQVYSPEFCAFVMRQTNSFILERGNDRGEWPLGVDLHQCGRYRAQVMNPFTKIASGRNKAEYVGMFDCPHEAHEAWKRRKHEMAQQVADLEPDERVANALRVRYSS